MALRPILVAPDPRLKQKSAPVEGGVTDAHRALMDDMLETMYAAPGIGLAAIQVGEPLRIIVMDLSRDEDAKAPRHFVNPQILWTSEETLPYEEGCLSSAARGCDAAGDPHGRRLDGLAQRGTGRHRDP